MIRKNIKISLLMSVFLLLITILGFSVPKAQAETVGDAKQSLINWYQVNKPQPDNWEEILGLKQAGVLDIDETNWSVELNNDSKAVDFASAILGLDAIGSNPEAYTNEAGTEINLVQCLIDKQQADGSFGGSINNTIYAIIALEQVKGSYNKGNALTFLVSQQKQDGGFALSGKISDPDVTGMALVALANSNDSGIEVSSSITKALDYLAKAQLDSGGFASYGQENAESTAIVIRGLLACGQDVTKWTKNDNNIIDALLSFRLSDGSFSHLIGGARSDMSTRQVLMTIAALAGQGYEGFLLKDSNEGGEDQNGTNVVQVRVEGSNKTLKQGSVALNGTALDALRKLVGEENITFNQWGMVQSILREVGQSAVTAEVDTSWKYYVIRDGQVETTAFSAGPDSYNIQDGDKIIFYIGAYDNTTWGDKTYFPLVNISPVEPKVGQTLTVLVQGQYFEWATNDFVTVPVEEATVVFNGAEYTTENSQAKILLENEGTVTYQVYKQHDDGYPELIRTEIKQLQVKPEPDDDVVKEPDTITVDVRVTDKDGDELFDGDVELAEDQADAFHALVETGLDYEARWGNTYIYEIEGIREESSGTAGWKYKVNRRLPSIPAIDYEVEDGDRVIWFWAIDADDEDEEPEEEIVEEVIEEVIVEEVIEPEALLLEETPAFTDVDANNYSWAIKEIQYLAAKGIVSGTSNGIFNPERKVTRAEFVTMLVRALLEEEKVIGDTKFTDVDDDYWCAAEIRRAATVGLARGYNDGSFRPDELVTREQLAAILTRALDLKPITAEQQFKDHDAISPWAREAVWAAVNNQLVKGYPDGSFKPQNTASRAETAVFIYRLLHLK